MPYFDHNATSPLHPVAREAWLEASTQAWHNPGGLYRSGARAHALLEEARERLADLLHCRPDQVVFTSGATESANAVIRMMAAGASASDRIAVSPTEHPAVLDAANAFWGGRIIGLQVDRAGRVDEEHLRAVVRTDRPRLTCVMAANNETGVLAAVERVAAVCREAASPLLCDATQWFGRMLPDRLRDGDFLVGGAHKFGGPRGVGFLRLAAGRGIGGWLHGGGQEGGRRAGTENLPSILSMVAVLEHLTTHELQGSGSREVIRRTFEAELKASIPSIRIVGEEADRLWNTVSVILPAGENSRWVARLDRLGFEVSTGSACATGAEAPSHVLGALGLEPTEARRVIRISSGWSTKPEDWEALRAALAGLVAEEGNSPVVRIIDPGSL